MSCGVRKHRRLVALLHLAARGQEHVPSFTRRPACFACLLASTAARLSGPWLRLRLPILPSDVHCSRELLVSACDGRTNTTPAGPSAAATASAAAPTRSLARSAACGTTSYRDTWVTTTKRRETMRETRRATREWADRQIDADRQPERAADDGRIQPSISPSRVRVDSIYHPCPWNGDLRSATHAPTPARTRDPRRLKQVASQLAKPSFYLCLGSAAARPSPAHACTLLSPARFPWAPEHRHLYAVRRPPELAYSF